jgi:hypothetical protein
MSLIGSPARVRSILPSSPRTEPNATCSARRSSVSQPASRAVWKTIAKCIVCGMPTT